MSQPCCIFHLITSLDVGGVENQLAKVVSSYDRNLFSPIVCCLSHKGAIGEELERRGIPVKVLGEKGGGFHPRILRRLCHLLREERVAILRAHKYHSAFYGVLAGRMAQVEAIIPSYHLPQAARKPRRRLMIRFLSHLSDSVVAVSFAVKENLTGMGIPESKIKVIHNGVDLREFQDLVPKEVAREELGIPSGKWVIGGIGRMKPQKGYGTLLQALPLLEKGGLSDYSVLLVGDGKIRGDLEQEARSIGREEKVKFLGIRRDIPRLLRAMDLFAFPSLWEGFGTSLVEAMAAGIPIVASDLPCVREIIPDERYGLLVPARSADALAAAILQVWKGGTLGEARTRAAQDRALERFSLVRVVKSYQDLFREILVRKSREGIA
jgi:glycosyltransferase involved in cell wall biosynthesis